MTRDAIVLKFIYKLLCILKAAADGWIVTYIGGNKFEFTKMKMIDKQTSLKKVFKNYTEKLQNIFPTTIQ